MSMWTTMVRRGDQVARNPMRPLIADLDELPYVDRDLFDYGEMLAENTAGSIYVGAAAAPIIAPTAVTRSETSLPGPGRYVRFSQCGAYHGELRQLRDRYSGPSAVRTVNFQDDTFTLDRSGL